MTTQSTQTQTTQSQSNEEQAEKLRRVLSVKDPAKAQTKPSATKPKQPAR
jgi:hypothetical protein